ncbi:unnamed protein product, partial [Didymodactylos carnosus]
SVKSMTSSAARAMAMFVSVLGIIMMPLIVVGQGVFDPPTMTAAGCSGTNQWTAWLDVSDPTIAKGEFEVTKHLQQLYPLVMCPSPTAIETRTVYDAAPASTGDVFKLTIIDGLMCLNPFVTGFKNKICTDYKVRYCCPRTTIGQITTPVTPIRGTCGRQQIQPYRQRIVGGIDAVPNSWPWLVSLQLMGSHQCGGSLIDNRHVLTAAHCLNQNLIGQYSVVVGMHNRLNLNTGYTQRIPIQRIFKHEQYNPGREDNDIAILRLSVPVTLNQYTSIVCLPGPDPPVNANVIIAGWGLTSERGRLSDNLRQATVQVMEPRCSQVYAPFTVVK